MRAWAPVSFMVVSWLRDGDEVGRRRNRAEKRTTSRSGRSRSARGGWGRCATAMSTRARGAATCGSDCAIDGGRSQPGNRRERRHGGRDEPQEAVDDLRQQLVDLRRDVAVHGQRTSVRIADVVALVGAEQVLRRPTGAEPCDPAPGVADLGESLPAHEPSELLQRERPLPGGRSSATTSRTWARVIVMTRSAPAWARIAVVRRRGRCCGDVAATGAADEHAELVDRLPGAHHPGRAA